MITRERIEIVANRADDAAERLEKAISRHPAGSDKGGQFAPKGTGGGSSGGAEKPKKPLHERVGLPDPAGISDKARLQSLLGAVDRKEEGMRSADASNRAAGRSVNPLRAYVALKEYRQSLEDRIKALK
jgi:hypothetical protein